jgi:hypothetical protein
MRSSPSDGTKSCQEIIDRADSDLGQSSTRQRLISIHPVVSPSHGRGGGWIRCGQCLEAKSGEKAGGADIPWIRNYEGARVVMERAETDLPSLGDTEADLPIRIFLEG